MKQIENYDHRTVEKKWQKFWADNKTFYFDPNDKREKYYALSMFLYPSGEMHMGHLRNFSIGDVNARFKRLQGYNVLQPTGADAFGLPAENAAIKNHVHPSEWTYKNLDRIMQSMLSCGLSFDTSRTFATCDPEYYGFQQEIFIKMYMAGMAFQKESYVNWDPVDQTVLANEQVVNGRGWRSDALVEKKKLKQWFLKITDYAEELLGSLKNGDLDGWPEKVRLMQENWIGKSEGAIVHFTLTPTPLPKGEGAGSSSISLSLGERGRGEDDNKYSSPKTIEMARNLRQKINLPEQYLWEFLRDRQLDDLKFRRQHPIGNYVVDFACVEKKLIVEIDGKVRELFNEEKDKLREEKLKKEGWKILRFNSKEVMDDLFGVLEKISRFATLTPTPLPQVGEGNILVYTTRPDTLFGASFVGISVDHPIAQELAKNNEKIAEFIEETKGSPVDEESMETMEKKGIGTGLFVEHPFDKNWKLPVYVANFILMDYGTGAIFGCPAHDERDYEFAKKYDLPIKRVVIKKEEYDNYTKDLKEFILDPLDRMKNIDQKDLDDIKIDHRFLVFDTPSNDILPFTEEGIAINSDFLNGLPTKEAKAAAIEKIEAMGIGERKINYRLRDWGISRQRYWGCPIPMVYCEHCGVVPEKIENLPVKLPEDVVFDGHGNPLANHPTWKHTKCPKCGGAATRETDTMDTFVDSSWYFMRFVDLDKKHPVNTELCNKVLPIDQYVGGIEHAIMHLIYSRYFTKAMGDLGYISKSIKEPAKRLLNQGLLCHKAYKDGKEWCYPWNVKEEGGKYFDTRTNKEVKCEGTIKMSKSKCNVVDVRGILDDYGADASRMLILSDTPVDRDSEWTREGVEGCWKYINKLWKFGVSFAGENDMAKLSKVKITKVNGLLIENHKAIRDITAFLENLEYNKAIARIREFSNALERFLPQDEQDIAIKYSALVDLVKMIAPFTPHVCEELNSILGQTKTLDIASWPTYNEQLTIDSEVTIAIQVNGKLRGDIRVAKDEDRAIVEKAAREHENVKKYLEDGIKKVIVVPNKLVNFVV